MGLFKKIREADKALDRFVEGVIGNAINKVSDFANTRTYTIDLTLDGEVIGKIEVVTSNINYTMDKVNNYLAQDVSLDRPVDDALVWYRTLDRIDIGASKQVVRLDEDKVRRIFITLQEKFGRK